MKKFMVTYHQNDGFKKMDASPEDMAKGMEAWMTWAQNCGDKLIDMGSPLANSKALKPDGSASDSGQGVAGFSMVQAADMDEARSLFANHPHLAWDADCSIEIHEFMPMPGQEN